MKKRILSLLLVLSILAAMLVMPVSGSEIGVDTTALPETCPCGCGLSLEQVTWKAYDPNTAGGVYSGHYYLAEDYAQKSQYTVNADTRIVLDLRGYTLTTKGYSRLYLNYGYIAVMDTVGGGRMCAKTSGTGNGGVVAMTYSDIDSALKPAFELYSGILTVDADNQGALRGGLVSVGSQSTFRMYGGMVMDGCSQGTSARAGGCLASTTSTSRIEILGGTVVGGVAPSDGGNIYATGGGTVILRNCRVIGGKATGNGGNIYQSGGTLTIENCVISDGASEGDYGGGNVCAISKARVTVRNSTIRNGYALHYGGNAYLASGTQLLEGATLTAGVAQGGGGNLRMTSKAVTTLDNCTVSGDVSSGGTLTLKGATKIGLNNNGLDLIYDGGTGAVDASGLSDGAEIFVNADGVFTDEAAKAEYFKPAIRTVITETAEGLTAAQAADGETGGYCPHCMEQVVWETFAPSDTVVTSGHYYLTDAKTVSSQLKIGNKTDGKVTAVEDVVLDLSGNAVTATYRTAYIYAGSTLSVLDSIGGGSVSGKGTSAAGGMVYNEDGTVNIYGGKFTYKAGASVGSGGILYSTGNVNIHGGVFDAGAYNNASKNGGVLCQSNETVLRITAGYFRGGTASGGGTVYIGNNTDSSITGGQFHGGTAATGGNIRVSGSTSYRNGSITISGAYFEGGHGTTSSGNMYILYYKNILVKDTCILRGTADGYGGNVVLGASPNGALYEDCLILWGSADRGGNLHSASEKTDALIKNTTLVEGTATGNGGNMAGIQGKVEFSGCSLICGKAGGNGGNLYAAASTENAGILLTDGTKLLSGTAATGGNLFVYGPVEMDSAFVSCGKATLGQDLYLDAGTESTKLTIGEGCTGNVQMAVAESRLGAGIYGAPIVGGYAQKLNLGITLEGDYGQPRLCAKNGNLTVAVARAGGRWYADANEAASSCEAGEYVTLYADAAMEITESITVDLNGNTLTVTGSGMLYGMDSSGDGLELPAGKVIGNVQIPEVCRSADNRLYVSVTENGETTFHRLDMRITGAALRPSVSGIYYTGTWGYDAVLAEKLTTAGVAASTVAMPGDNFMEEDSGCLWTSFDASAMISGENKTGAIISGILSEDRASELNNAYGKMPVFATAYVALTSGTVITSDDPDDHNDIGYSVHSLMQQLEALTDADPNAYSRYLLPARNFYEKWLDLGMGDWEFSKIPSRKDDGVMDIIFIGNSFTYYGKCVLDKGQNAYGLDRRANDQGYFYQVCKANGVEASVTNFTFGGHQLSDYSSHSCSADRGHNGLDHLAYLTERNYDYVVFQQGSADSGLEIMGECQKLMEVFLEVNPDTKFVFLVHHMAHIENHSYLPDLKKLEDAGFIVVDWGALVADVIDGTTAVPGAAQTYNKNSFVIHKKESDGFHENMLAGYITAQMAFCAITGKSAVGQDYSFCGDTSVNKAFDFDKFLEEQYVYDPGNSNFIEIFNSESDMRGLQQLIDQYLAVKAYRNY